MEEMTSLQTATAEFLRQFWSAIYPPPPEQGLLSVASPDQLSSRADKMSKYLAKTRSKVAALNHKASQIGMDARRIDAVRDVQLTRSECPFESLRYALKAFAPTLAAVDKALQTHAIRSVGRFG